MSVTDLVSLDNVHHICLILVAVQLNSVCPSVALELRLWLRTCQSINQSINQATNQPASQTASQVGRAIDQCRIFRVVQIMQFTFNRTLSAKQISNITS